jgi:hypothetical protein
VLKEDHLAPGQQVSLHHFVCSTKGRLFGTHGKTSQDTMLCGGCIFVDHASNFVQVKFQAHLTTHETLKAKQKYKLMYRDLGVVVQSFLSDNVSAFSSKEFAAHLSKFEQVIRFSGTGAHHHNGCAERSIQKIMSIARTMMFHSVADSCLWPMAVQHAVFLYNHMPNEHTGISPHDVFTRSRWEQRKFHDLHVWGCPVYCLEKDMHDGKKLPRWKPRSHHTMNMGLLAKHASTVPLVLNLDTGYINIHFNIIFDDWFATVAASVDTLPDLNSPEWAEMFGESTFQFEFDEDDVKDTIDLNRYLPEALARSHHAVARAMDQYRPDVPLSIPPPVAESLLSPPTPPILVETVDDNLPRPPRFPLLYPTREAPSTPTRETRIPPTGEPDRLVVPPLVGAPRQQREIKQEKVMTPAPSNPLSEGPRRSSRTNFGVGPTRLVPNGYLGLVSPASEVPGGPRFAPAMNTSYLVVEQPEFASIYSANGLSPPYAFKASNSDPDTLSYEKAMKDVDKSKWIAAAEKEIKSLEDQNTWTEVDISDATSRVLPSQWVFKRKRTPDGNIKSYKGRTVAKRDLEEGGFDTYAPVVAWSSVRFFLVVSLILEWNTCSIDFSSVFVQAKLEKAVWLHLPQGFK